MNKEYLEYLKTPEWQNKRAWALKWADYACQVCESEKDLEVHHRTYRNIRNELPGDLTVLCGECHGLFHKRLKKPRRLSLNNRKPLSPRHGATVATLQREWDTVKTRVKGEKEADKEDLDA